MALAIWKYQATAPAMKNPLSIIIFALVLVSFVTASAQQTEIYRVGIGDVLDIRLLNSAANNSSTLFTVVANGVIDLPIAGERDQGRRTHAGRNPDPHCRGA